jgi:TolB protein
MHEMATFRSGLLALLLLASTVTVALGAERGTIAYVDENGEIHAVAPDGTNDRKLATAEPLQPIAYRPAQDDGRNFFTWPVWSPDATRLAAFRVSGEGDSMVDSLYVIDVATTRVVERYERPGLRPIYAYWAPAGDRLAMLLQLDQGFSLSLWPDAKSDKPRSLAVGVPFFYDWSKDSKRLLAHLGNDPDSPAGHSVTMLEVESGKRTSISKSPAVFGPASWSPDGALFAYATVGEKNTGTLVIADANGKERKSIPVSPRVAFNWSPTKTVLAVATTKAPDDPTYGEIKVIDAKTGKATSLRREPISAFFWSPDGTDLLLASRDLESGAFEWIVVDVATKAARKLGRFYPSRPQLMVFQYFDQYALSHRVWSPDGRSFVFSGAIEDDSASPHPILSPRVYVVDVTGKQPPLGVGDGHTGFWSPK